MEKKVKGEMKVGEKKDTSLEKEIDDKMKEELREMFKSEIEELAGEVLWDLMERVQKLEDWKLDIKHGWVKVNE